MQIINAQREQIPELVGLAAQMHVRSPAYERIAFNSGRLVDFIQMLIDEPGGMAIVARNDAGIAVGGMLAMATPLPWSDTLSASDLGLYVDPYITGSGRAGIRLISHYVGWAQGLGVPPDLIRLAESSGIAPQRFARLCTALGFVQCGSVYRWQAATQLQGVA